MNTYWKTYLARYLVAAPEIQRASKRHWKQVLLDCIKDGRDADLPASILAAISLVTED